MSSWKADSEPVAQLTRDLLAFIGRGCEVRDEEGFNQLALREFALQFANIEPYRRFCLNRGIHPERISRWEEIPAVPTDAFKHLTFFCFEEAEVARVFSTSGTTQGERRGKSYFDRKGLEVMREAILQNARHSLFPDDLKVRILVLAPSPTQAPQMIMAYGMSILTETWGLPGSGFFIDLERGGFQLEVFMGALRQAEAEGTPVSVMGGTTGLANFFRYCQEKGFSFRLPAGSSSMDAGGYKGMAQEIPRKEFLACFPRYLGIPEACSINLLGMTELGSQFYENALTCQFRGVSAPRCKVNPPWTRTVVVDPTTLARKAKGEVGLLRHYDLTNRERILAIQTDDLGQEVEGGFDILGRAKGAESRGCSITIDEMMQSK